MLDTALIDSTMPGSPLEPPLAAADSLDVDRRLWAHNGEKWEFLWKSSMAESTNSWAAGFSTMLKTTNAVWHDFIFNTACMTRNERYLRDMHAANSKVCPFFLAP